MVSHDYGSPDVLELQEIEKLTAIVPQGGQYEDPQTDNKTSSRVPSVLGGSPRIHTRTCRAKDRGAPPHYLGTRVNCSLRPQ